MADPKALVQQNYHTQITFVKGTDDESTFQSVRNVIHAIVPEVTDAYEKVKHIF